MVELKIIFSLIGHNEELSPKSSSDNLQKLQYLAPSPNSKPVYNTLHSPNKSNFSSLQAIKTPSKMGSKMKSQAELGHDVDF
jgi:hypothetical protein